MKTYVHLWYYLPEFFLEWETSRTSDVEAIRTHILWSITSVQKSCHLWEKMEKYGTVQQATDVSIMLRPISMPVD